MTFIYPSSIATYGLPDRATKARAGRVREDEYPHPTTMYGCNKLYCEELGRYYARHYKQLSVDVIAARRLPGGPVPGSHLGDDAAGGRDVGLRARR